MSWKEYLKGVDKNTRMCFLYLEKRINKIISTKPPEQEIPKEFQELTKTVTLEINEIKRDIGLAIVRRDKRIKSFIEELMDGLKQMRKEFASTPIVYQLEDNPDKYVILGGDEEDLERLIEEHKDEKDIQTRNIGVIPESLAKKYEAAYRGVPAITFWSGEDEICGCGHKQSEHKYYGKKKPISVIKPPKDYKECMLCNCKNFHSILPYAIKG